MANETQLHMGRANQSHIFLDELQPNAVGPVKVMISRQWDVYNKNGQYMSTDFIVTDQKGNAMHCVTSHNRAHRFLATVKEGSVFVVSGFKVKDNKKDFRIMAESAYILEFDGSTNAGKVIGDTSSFVRYFFQFTPFERLVPCDNLYLVDVVGCALYVGTPKTKSTGARSVEFLLTNESGLQIPVTLWGIVGDEMIKKKGPVPGPYSCILTAMSTKIYYGELGISSTSSTQIIDNPDVPALMEFAAALRKQDLTQVNLEKVDSVTLIETLAELLKWGREWKNGLHPENGRVAFKNTIEIVEIRTRNGWYLITCSSGRCRKGLRRTHTGFHCDGCNSEVLYPHIRFKLQLHVRDDTMAAIVTLFDEAAEQLLGRTAKTMMDQELQGDCGDDVLPPILRDLIGTMHVFEIRGHSYYHAGEYEGFNCSQVIRPIVTEPASPIHAKQHANVAALAGTSPSASNPKVLSTPPKWLKAAAKKPDTIPTPAKREARKRKLILKDQECSSVHPAKGQVGLLSGNDEGGASDALSKCLDVEEASAKSVYTDLHDDASAYDRRDPRSCKKKTFSVDSGSDTDNDTAKECDTDG